MSITALSNSRVAVRRLSSVNVDGAPQYRWSDVEDMQFVRVRCEPGWLRPGKDMPMAVEAGKTPPRVGVLWAAVDSGLRAGDQLTFVVNEHGDLPVQGTFELKVAPDEAQGYSRAHHLEVQIVEVAQAVARGQRQMPDTDSIGDDEL
jgi:hypothetical protein